MASRTSAQVKVKVPQASRVRGRYSGPAGISALSTTRTESASDKTFAATACMHARWASFLLTHRHNASCHMRGGTAEG
eukprot:6601547-Pyramimonas_sp.AAC.1